MAKQLTQRGGKRSCCRWIVGAAVLAVTSDAQQQLCTPPDNSRTFHVKVDLFAGELGYFTFEECGNETMPTLGIEVGQAYTFVQADPSNYYHPLAFAYYPDSAVLDGTEVELGPTASGTASNGTAPCLANGTCPTPLYYEGDTLLGNEGNLSQSIGLETYERLFLHPVTEWNAMNFSVRLIFDDESYDKDIFYFCHIEHNMSGRIKLLRDGAPVSDADDPPIPYEYQTPSEFDAKCGTYGLDAYQLPNTQCPSKFVCGADDSQIEAIVQSAKCYDAFNCAMMAGMTTGAASGSEIALFLHHMIPHHQNAVNMAKTLLKLGGLKCDDLLDAEESDCVMTNMMLDTINSQNHQIQVMRGMLAELDLPPEDDCVVTVTSSSVGDGNDTNSTDGSTTSSAATSRRIASRALLWIAGALGMRAVADLL